MGELRVTQHIFPLLTPVIADCPPAEKKTMALHSCMGTALKIKLTCQCFLATYKPACTCGWKINTPFSLAACTELTLKSIESLKRQQTISVFLPWAPWACCGRFLLLLTPLNLLLNFVTKIDWGLGKSIRSAHSSEKALCFFKYSPRCFLK